MDIEIFPFRILGSDTTEKLLNEIESLDDVKRTVIHGPRFPPLDDFERKYGDRRVITINGEEVELKVKTGRIWIELGNTETIDLIDEICGKHLPFGYDINTNREQYIRKSRTVTDDMKYGNVDMPDELIGMTDQHSKFSESVSLIKKDKSNS